MLQAACPACHTRYRVPDTAAGKRTTCKRCGHAFRIPAASPAAAAIPVKPAATPAKPDRPAKPATTVPRPVAAEPESGLADLEALAGGEALEAPRLAVLADAPSYAPQPGAAASGPVYVQGSEADAVRGFAAYAQFMRAVSESLLFLRKPSNIIIFMMLWVLLTMRGALQTGGALVPPSVGMLPAITAGTIAALYMSFRMNVVAWSAGGEDDLPGLFNTDEGWFDGVFLPFWRMLVAYVFALLPALVFGVVLAYRMGSAVANSTNPVFGIPVPGTPAIVVLLSFAFAGMFMWPMLVLVVSCGGSVWAMFRLDLIVETIVRSLPAYLLVVLAVYVSFGAQVAVTAFVWQKLGATTNWRDDWMALFVVPTIFAGIGIYFEIIAMRAIGLYYRCFKDKFAWSWG